MTEKIGPETTSPKRKTAEAAQLAEVEAVKRAVEHGGHMLTAELRAQLFRKAKFYNATGFQVAAAIQRALKVADHSPSSKPQSAKWFAAVVENELKQRAPASRTATAG